MVWILVQAVCKGYQQITKLSAGKERFRYIPLVSYVFSGIRELAAKALHNLTEKAPEHLAKTGMCIVSL